MVEAAFPKLPYTPVVAKKLSRDSELAGIACNYLEDDGDGSLQVQIASLQLYRRSRMKAAISLLEDTNEGKSSATPSDIPEICTRQSWQTSAKTRRPPLEGSVSTSNQTRIMRTTQKWS
jgi:hypothetical protein